MAALRDGDGAARSGSRGGNPNPRKQKTPYRIDIDGNELRGDSKENKSVPVVFRDGAFFGYQG
jgi:hypothetical protein